MVPGECGWGGGVSKRGRGEKGTREGTRKGKEQREQRESRGQAQEILFQIT